VRLCPTQPCPPIRSGSDARAAERVSAAWRLLPSDRLSVPADRPGQPRGLRWSQRRNSAYSAATRSRPGARSRGPWNYRESLARMAAAAALDDLHRPASCPMEGGPHRAVRRRRRTLRWRSECDAAANHATL
jgi:hypothetical protein